MFRAWETFDEKLDKLLKKKLDYENSDFHSDFLLEKLQKEIEEYLFLEKRINEVFKLLQSQFKFSEEILKSIILPDSSLFKLSNKDIILRFKYYIELFGNKDLLCKVIKGLSCFYGNDKLFSWKDMYQAKRQMDWIKEFFNLDEYSTRIFIINNTYFFAKEPKKLEQKIEDYAKILGVDVEVIKDICLFTPSGFYSSTTERLEEKVNRFSEIFKIDLNTTKKLFVKYPFLINNPITIYTKCFNILKHLSANASSLIVENPFIIDLLNYDEKTYCGNFDRFDDFIDNIKFIKQNIGEIIRAYSWIQNDKLFSFCIVKKSDNKIECVVFGLKSGDVLNTNIDKFYLHNERIIPSYSLMNCKENYVENMLEEILEDISKKVE